MAAAVRLGPLRDLPPGTHRQVAISGHDLTVYNVAGSLYATSGLCHHQQAPLADGAIRTDDAGRPAIECPWHRWCYDLTTGERVDAPGTSLTVHQLAVAEDGWLVCLDPP